MTTSDDISAAAREPALRDLLGREPWPDETSAHAASVRGLSVLVTGAAGSIGSALSRRLAGLGPRELLLVDRRETQDPGVAGGSVRRSTGDLTDARFLASLPLETCDVIFHAAALKHLVPLERDPWSALEVNAVATLDLMDRVGLDGPRVVLVSSDKAADPSSILGASKLLAEAAVTGSGGLAVRLANVVDSDGSLIPRVRRAVRLARPIVVRDPAATRFLLTVDETITCLLEAAASGRPGDTLVPRGLRAVEVSAVIEWAAGARPPAANRTRLGPGEKRHERLTSCREIASRASSRLDRVSSSEPPPRLDHAELRRVVRERDARALFELLRARIPDWSPSATCAAALERRR